MLSPAERQRRYRLTPKGRAAKAAYRTTPKYRATERAYRKRPYVLARVLIQRRSPKAKARASVLRQRPGALTYQLAFRTSSKGRALRKAYRILYYEKMGPALRAASLLNAKTPQGKKTRSSYAKTPKGREIRARYHRTPEGREVARRSQTRRRRLVSGGRCDLTAAQWLKEKADKGHRCVWCGRNDRALTQDHLIPVSRGGEHTINNIVPACRQCNGSKHARVWFP